MILKGLPKKIPYAFSLRKVRPKSLLSFIVPGVIQLFSIQFLLIINYYYYYYYC